MVRRSRVTALVASPLWAFVAPLLDGFPLYRSFTAALRGGMKSSGENARSAAGAGGFGGGACAVVPAQPPASSDSRAGRSMHARRRLSSP
jgi:hypothetical protein